MSKLLKSLLFLSLFFTLNLLSIHHVFADDSTSSNSTTVQADPAPSSNLNLFSSPAPIDLVITPGSTGSALLKVKNGGTQLEHISVGLMKFDAYGEEGKPRIMDREKGDDFMDWVTFSENEFTILPGEWKTITATFNIPETASFGYYYAVTFGRSQNAKSGQTADISGAVATLVLVEARVADAVKALEVLDFSSAKRVYEFLPTAFNIKLRNVGNVHLAPRGNIFISRYGHPEEALLEVNLEKGNVLPQTNRIFISKWLEGFPIYVDKIKDDKIVLDKSNRPVQKLQWDFSQANKLRFGKYTANLLLAYDDGMRDVTVEATTIFWIIPWRLIAFALLVLGLVIFGLFSGFKNIWDRIKHK